MVRARPSIIAQGRQAPRRNNDVEPISLRRRACALGVAPREMIAMRTVKRVDLIHNKGHKGIFPTRR
jgi:hypothetical protein